MISTPNITPGQVRDLLSDNDITLPWSCTTPHGTRLKVATLKARDLGQRTGIAVGGRIVAVIVPVSDLDAVHYCEHAEPGGER